MKALLMFKDQDFDLRQPLPPQAGILSQDLELEVLVAAMAGEDGFVSDVCYRAVLGSVSDLGTIRHRQQILADCLKNRDVVREIYALTVDSLEVQRQGHWGFFGRDTPDGALSRALELLQGYLPLLQRLRVIAETHSGKFSSEGFRRLFDALISELSDAYFGEINGHLRALQFKDGVFISAVLGKGNKGRKYVLRRDADTRPVWKRWLLGPHPTRFSFTIHPRDQAGWRGLERLRDRGIALVADALGQSADHVLSFFDMLRTELAFYVGCITLDERLAELGAHTAFPLPAATGDMKLIARGLYDICLALSLGRKVVGNDVDAGDKPLVVITGANQGGKSTLLRSVGLAQLMMQSGMFVAAESFSCDVRNGLFTHYKREEDSSMTSGKFDEELARMSTIVDSLNPSSVVLFNESFAATNEREGSEIAYQIVCALLDRGIRVVFVTHMYDLARRLSQQQKARGLFLRAERAVDGQRSFKLLEGAPLPTAFGRDLYRQIFDDDTSSIDNEAGRGGKWTDESLTVAAAPSR